MAVAYKFILHVIALVLAILIRKVKVNVLNDSRETIAIIYASTVLLLVACLMLGVLSETVSLLSLVWSILVFLVSMTHLGLTFVPKVSNWYYLRVHLIRMTEVWITDIPP